MVVPNAVFLTSGINSGKKSKEDIFVLGERLANEIIEYMQDDDEDVHIT